MRFGLGGALDRGHGAATMTLGERTRGAIGPAIAFLAAGALCRFMIRHVESRIQIVGLVVVALAVEAVRRRRGGAPSLIRPIATGIAAAIGVVLMKLHLETSWF